MLRRFRFQGQLLLGERCRAVRCCLLGERCYAQAVECVAARLLPVPEVDDELRVVGSLGPLGVRVEVRLRLQLLAAVGLVPPVVEN